MLQRHRYGAVNIRRILAKASTAIAIGDILIIATNNATPCGDATAGANSNASVELATHTNFLGVSMDQRLAANATAGNIAVATSGVFEFDCLDEAAKGPGTFYGVGLLGGGTNQASQIVQAVATANLAIGKLAELKPANAATCRVEIQSSVWQNGVQTVDVTT